MIVMAEGDARRGPFNNGVTRDASPRRASHGSRRAPPHAILWAMPRPRAALQDEPSTAVRPPRPVVVGIGEILWDVFPDGEHFGGAPANVAVHAAALGAESWLVSAVGRDARGAAALASLDAAGVRRDAVAELDGRATGIVRVVLDADGHPHYAFTEESARDHVPWSEAVARAVARADAVCFGSIAQRRTVSRATIQRAVAESRRARWRLFDVNLRQSWHDAGVLAASLGLSNAVKLNAEELPVVARLVGAEGATPEAQLRSLAAQFHLELAAMTLGADGAFVIAGGESYAVAGVPTTVVDTVGAGDAFAAALLVGLLRGGRLGEVCDRANRVAAFVCSRPGATPPLPEGLRFSP